MKPPCPRKCPDRYPGCGATCSRWQEYVKAREEDYKQRRMKSMIGSACHDGFVRLGAKAKQP